MARKTRPTEVKVVERLVPDEPLLGEQLLTEQERSQLRSKLSWLLRWQEGYRARQEMEEARKACR